MSSFYSVPAHFFSELGATIHFPQDVLKVSGNDIVFCKNCGMRVTDHVELYGRFVRMSNEDSPFCIIYPFNETSMAGQEETFYTVCSDCADSLAEKIGSPSIIFIAGFAFQVFGIREGNNKKKPIIWFK